MQHWIDTLPQHEATNDAEFNRAAHPVVVETPKPVFCDECFFVHLEDENCQDWFESMIMEQGGKQ